MNILVILINCSQIVCREKLCVRQDFNISKYSIVCMGFDKHISDDQVAMSWKALLFVLFKSNFDHLSL